jgi:Anaphase-promoting complex subunit 4 WD40 domain
VNTKRLLEQVPIDPAAEERAWAVVRAAYARHEPVRGRLRRGRWAVAAAVAVAAVVAAALSPPGRAVVDAVRRSIGIEHAAPALFRLPAPGRLLVSGAGGTWVVSADGSKRRLGDYREASWSPHGLFVVVARPDELAAVEPGDGRVHWSLARPQVSLPRWGGSRTDTRVAYLSGGTLRVVAGDGTGDRAFGPAALFAPAWQPERHVLAYAPRRGGVLVVDTDSRAVVARYSLRGDGVVRSLVWSADGKRLAVATQRKVLVFSGGGRLALALPLRGATALAFSHSGMLAVLRAGKVQTVGVEGVQTVLTVRSRLAGLAWAPGSRWLVTAIPAADQWVFLGARRLQAVSHIARQFGGVVSLDGWMPGA